MASERDSSQDADEESGQTEQTEQSEPTQHEGTKAAPQEEPVYNDRSKLDFDPDDGLYTGTAVEGGTDIPGPHESVDDVEPGDESDEDESDEGEASGEGESDESDQSEQSEQDEDG